MAADGSDLGGEEFISAHSFEGEAPPPHRGAGNHSICGGSSLQLLLGHILVDQELEPRPIPSDSLLLAKP